MDSTIKKILFIENASDNEILFKRLFEEFEEGEYQILRACSIDEASKLLAIDSFEVIIFEILEENTESLNNVKALQSVASDMAIIVLSESFNEAFAQKVINMGVQNYLVKGEVDSWRLSRELKYAIESKQQQGELQFLEHHDQLTELANKALFVIRLEHAVHWAKRRGEIVALMHLDLDHFKRLTDELGQELGDALLVEVANRLTSSIRSVDTVSRINFDEFTIVIEAIKYIDNVYLVADKVISKLSEPFVIQNQTIQISTSMGVASYPIFGLDTDTLIKNADHAMNLAKSKGGNQYQVYGVE